MGCLIQVASSELLIFNLNQLRILVAKQNESDKYTMETPSATFGWSLFEQIVKYANYKDILHEMLVIFFMDQLCCH